MIPATSTAGERGAPVERWRPVPGSQGLYSVSDLGRVRSELTQKGRARGRIMRCSPDSKGYLKLHLSLPGGIDRVIKVHCAVALAFLGPRPPGAQINHRSGDKRDNRVSNLEYVTGLENIRHARAAGLFQANQPRGQKHGMSKLTEDQVRQIRALRGTATLAELAQRFGVAKPTVHHVVTRKTWKHVA